MLSQYLKAVRCNSPNSPLSVNRLIIVIVRLYYPEFYNVVLPLFQAKYQTIYEFDLAKYSRHVGHKTANRKLTFGHVHKASLVIQNVLYIQQLCGWITILNKREILFRNA